VDVTINDLLVAPITHASLLLLSINEVSLFAGVGGAFTLDGNSRPVGIDTSSATGVGFTGGTLDLAIVRAGTRAWTGLAASATSVSPYGLPDALHLDNLSVFKNSAVDSASLTPPPLLEWANVAQVSGTALANLHNNVTLAVEGALTLNLN